MYYFDTAKSKYKKDYLQFHFVILQSREFNGITSITNIPYEVFMNQSGPFAWTRTEILWDVSG